MNEALQGVGSHFRVGPSEGTFLPDYEGRGILNVSATVERHFGVDTPYGPLRDDVLPPAMLSGVRRIALLVVDALGYGQLERALETGNATCLSSLLERGEPHLSAVTSVFPSTTVCALTTLGTGLPPGHHGVTSAYLYDDALGMVIGMLEFSPSVAGVPLQAAGIDPADWLGLPTIYQRLAGAGVHSVVLDHRQFEHNPLSRFNHRGASFLGFDSLSDLCVNLRTVLEQPPGFAYTYAYWGMLDAVAHRYGTRSPQHDAEIQLLDYAVGEILLRGLRAPDTLLLILADHGQIDCTPERTLWLNDYPELLRMLRVPPAGLDRAVALYTYPECYAQAGRWLEANLGEYLHVMHREEFENSGLYGPQSHPMGERAGRRAGDLLLLPREDRCIRYQRPGVERKVWNVGNHGGLSGQEMLVPLLALRAG